MKPQPISYHAPLDARAIVDELIVERAPKLASSLVWPLVKPCLNLLLGYNKAIDLVASIADLGGHEALRLVSDRLSLNTSVINLQRIPKSGACVVVCNHPTGIADGIAVYDTIKAIRDDAIFFANADALRVSPRLGEAVIPVEWVESKRTREKTRATLQAARQAFEEQRCVVVFPAGRLARREANGCLIDPSWMPTAISMAQKHSAPCLPMHLKGPNSFWFHAFAAISAELRDITLFHEFLNKAGKDFVLTIGPLIEPSQLHGEAVAITNSLKEYVEKRLETNPDLVFEGLEKHEEQ